MPETTTIKVVVVLHFYDEPWKGDYTTKCDSRDNCVNAVWGCKRQSGMLNNGQIFSL